MCINTGFSDYPYDTFLQPKKSIQGSFKRRPPNNDPYLI